MRIRWIFPHLCLLTPILFFCTLSIISYPEYTTLPPLFFIYLLYIRTIVKFKHLCSNLSAWIPLNFLTMIFPNLFSQSAFEISVHTHDTVVVTGWCTWYGRRHWLMYTIHSSPLVGVHDTIVVIGWCTWYCRRHWLMYMIQASSMVDVHDTVVVTDWSTWYRRRPLLVYMIQSSSLVDVHDSVVVTGRCTMYMIQSSSLVCVHDTVVVIGWCTWFSRRRHLLKKA